MPVPPPLILVVDDDEPVRHIVARTLRRQGYRVIEAASGTDAIARVDTLDERLALVVSDVVMPGMDGGALAARLRERQPGLPVLFVSGTSEFAPESAGTGPAGFLAKPFRGDVFAAAVRTLLGRSGRPRPSQPAGRRGAPPRHR